MQLSAALIVRNEGRNLRDCLRPLSEIADEIVVVDTGSVDDTRQVARDNGARVFDFPWIDDYSAARNEALRHCRGEWLLAVDADERYHPCNRETLAGLLGDSSKIAFSTVFRIRAGFTTYRRIRLFRNHPLIRYQGIIHENVLAGVERYRREHGGVNGESPLFADHVGYDGDQRPKNRHNLPILLKCAEQEPDRVLIWCHLANVHASLGNAPEADRCWNRACEVAANRKDPLRIYDSVAYLGILEWKISRDEEADGLLKEARQRFPGNLHLFWLEGRHLMKQGRHREAITRFEQLITARQDPNFESKFGNPANDPDHWFGYDERIFGALSFESLATCHFELEEYNESLKYLNMAAGQQPPTEELLLKKCLCMNLLQRPGFVS